MDFEILSLITAILSFSIKAWPYTSYIYEYCTSQFDDSIHLTKADLVLFQVALDNKLATNESQYELEVIVSDDISKSIELVGEAP